MSLEDIKFWQVVENFFFSSAVQSYGNFIAVFEFSTNFFKKKFDSKTKNRATVFNVVNSARKMSTYLGIMSTMSGRLSTNSGNDCQPHLEKSRKLSTKIRKRQKRVTVLQLLQFQKGLYKFKN